MGPAYSDPFLTQIFMKPWIRMGAYFIGVTAAIRFFNQRENLEGSAVAQKNWLSFTLYFIGFGLMTATYVVLWAYGSSLAWGNAGMVIFATVAPVCFIFGLSMGLFICANRNKDPCYSYSED